MSLLICMWRLEWNLDLVLDFLVSVRVVLVVVFTIEFLIGSAGTHTLAHTHLASKSI